MQILIIKLGAIGDVIRTTSILPGLKDKYKDCSIDWVTKKESFDILKNNNSIWLKALVLGLLVCSIIDTRDTLKVFKKKEYQNYLTNESFIEEMKSITKSIDFSKYQAILPIPYYHVGSENYDYTIDPDESFCTLTMQLSLMSNLPLMSSKMSRTAEYQVKEFFKLFLSEDLPHDLLKHLSDKPILVLYNKEVHNKMIEKFKVSKYPHSKELIFKNADIIKRYNMELLCEYRDIFYFYHFDVIKLKVLSRKNLLDNTPTNYPL